MTNLVRSDVNFLWWNPDIIFLPSLKTWHFGLVLVWSGLGYEVITLHHTLYSVLSSKYSLIVCFSQLKHCSLLGILMILEPPAPPDTNPADQLIWKVQFQSCFYFPAESFSNQDWKCSSSQIKPQTIRSVLRRILNPVTSDVQRSTSPTTTATVH